MSRSLFVVAILALVPLFPGRTVARPAESWSLEVLVGGRPVERHMARGRTYIEALPGEEYSIRLRNRTAGRVAIALAVDGLNTIDARTTTPSRASKWILGPYQTITIDGWQTSTSTARRFFFTTEEESYGAWVGKTSNLGVITAAVFREKQPQPAPIQKDGKEGRPESSGRRSGAPDAPAEALSDDLAATGIGRKVGHEVQRVEFHAESVPAAVIEMRYEYRDALVRLGVLPKEYVPCDDPLSRRERAHGFQDSGFAPDPYGHHCR